MPVAKKGAPVGPKPKKRPPTPVVAEPEANPDALMAATLSAMEWARKRRAQLLYIVGGIAAAGAIFAALTYRRNLKEEQASAILARGVSAELAPIRQGDEDQEIAKRITFYGNEEEKQKAALAAYAEARSKFGDTGPGILALIGEAGVHLDRKEWDQALAQYTEARASSLGRADVNVKLRCIEGIGYAHEGKGQLDDARRSFDEIANLDIKGAKPLGLFHLARIDVAKGDKDAAINKLKNAREDVGAPGAPSSRYLHDSIDKLLSSLDPSAVPKGTGAMGRIPGMPGGKGAGSMSKEEIDKLMKQLQSGGGLPKKKP